MEAIARAVFATAIRPVRRDDRKSTTESVA
jgi:hypothetical protein